MAFKPKFDLRAFFDKESKTIRTEYKKLLSRGRGVLNDDAPRKKKNNRQPWLVNTGETRDHGIERKWNKHSATIFASGKKHSGRTRRITKAGKVKTGQSKNRPTYYQLYSWHNKGISSASSETYSGIFGQLPIRSNFEKRLKEEIRRQSERELHRMVADFNRGRK